MVPAISKKGRSASIVLGKNLRFIYVQSAGMFLYHLFLLLLSKEIAKIGISRAKTNFDRKIISSISHYLSFLPRVNDFAVAEIMEGLL